MSRIKYMNINLFIYRVETQIAFEDGTYIYNKHSPMKYETHVISQHFDSYHDTNLGTNFRFIYE